MRKVISAIFLFLFYWNQTTYASFDKDPLKETRTGEVPITEELLTREGEPGPASPTYRGPESGEFLTKTPYQKVDKYGQDEENSGEQFWDRWFFWRNEDSSEDVDNK